MIPRERIGTLSQVVRVDSFVEAQGPGRGTRRTRLVNGGGLEFEVHPDRGLDIGRVTVDGVQIAWISPTEIGSPDAYEPEGTNWLRTFGGGFLATCGLDTFGPASDDDGRSFGLHGRYGAQRAVVTRAEATTDEVVVEGAIRQATVFGENLEMRRRISSPVGSDEILIEDVVTNLGFDEQPHMVLYHMNLGWPLIGDAATVDIPSTGMSPRDSDAEYGADRWREVGPPVAGFREQVFVHALPAGANEIVVANPENGLEFRLVVDGAQLPALHQWKMTGQGHYVLGIEPANTPHIQGRASARAHGELPVLAPGESRSYRVSARIRHGASARATRGAAA